MTPLITLWYQAKAERRGLCLETDDLRLLTQRLYKARVEAMDPELEELILVNSPTTPGQLWIVKKGLPDGET